MIKCGNGERKNERRNMKLRKKLVKHSIIFRSFEA